MTLVSDIHVHDIVENAHLIRVEVLQVGVIGENVFARVEHDARNVAGEDRLNLSGLG
jgi:hypothetical protein